MPINTIIGNISNKSTMINSVPFLEEYTILKVITRFGT
jgi:hypothetical protein